MQQTIATASDAIEEWSETDHRMMARLLTCCERHWTGKSWGFVGCVIATSGGDVIGEDSTL